MNRKSLIVLLAVTAIALVLAVVSGLGSGNAPKNSLAGVAVLPGFEQQLKDVDRVTLSHENQKTTLKRAGEGWQVEDRGDYPADEQRVRHLLLGLAELQYVEPKTREEKLYSRLEVEDTSGKDAKSTLITIADTKGALLGELIVGKRKYDQLGGGNDGVYLRKPGQGQAWLARGTIDVNGDSTIWLDKKLMDLPAAQVKQADFTAADGAKITIQRDKPEDQFHLADLPKGKSLKSDGVLDGPASALSTLDLLDVKPAKDLPMPSSGVSHARFVAFDGLTVTLDIIDQDKTSWVHFGISATGDMAAHAKELNDKLAPWLFSLPAGKTDLLKTNLAALLAPPPKAS